MKTTQVQQRFPDAILEAVDNFAASRSMNRTVAINHICQFFLEAIEIEKLRRENKELREKVVRLAMERVPSRGIVETVGFCGLGVGHGMECLEAGRTCNGCPDYSPERSAE
jgi:hypothetical protein